MWGNGNQFRLFLHFCHCFTFQKKNHRFFTIIVRPPKCFFTKVFTRVSTRTPGLRLQLGAHSSTAHRPGNQGRTHLPEVRPGAQEPQGLRAPGLQGPRAPGPKGSRAQGPKGPKDPRAPSAQEFKGPKTAMARIPNTIPPYMSDVVIMISYSPTMSSDVRKSDSTKIQNEFFMFFHPVFTLGLRRADKSACMSP